MENKNVFVMKQPALGKRISDLRKQKGYTQEELVERCNISVRTIQRIESGEVTPRSFTIKTILEALGLELSEVFTEEQYTLSWTHEEKKKLNISWVSGIFVLIISSIGLVVEVVLQYKKVVNNFTWFFSTLTSILLLASLFFFLRGYKVIADKHKNKILSTSTYLYWFLTLISSILGVLFILYRENEVLYWSIGLITVVVLGIAELIIGIGIIKLKENYGSYAQIVGLLKIINGGMLLSVILSPLGLFLIVPVLILEIIFLYNVSTKGNIDH